MESISEFPSNREYFQEDKAYSETEPHKLSKSNNSSEDNDENENIVKFKTRLDTDEPQNLDFLNENQNTFRSSSFDEKESNERQNKLISNLVSDNKIKQNSETENRKKSVDKNVKVENKKVNKEIYDKSFTKRPVEDELYIDALKRKEKQDKINNVKVKEAMINSASHKLSNKSYQISINKIEKNIDNVFSLVDSENIGEVNFYQLGEVLYYLNIFRESFNTNGVSSTSQILSNSNLDAKKHINDHLKSFYSYKDIQNNLKQNKKSEIRKKKEILFIEQLWITLNPESKFTIKVEMIKEFLKILCSPLSSSIKETSDILIQFLEAYFFLDEHQSKKLISPVTEKSMTKDEIWSIEKLVKEYLNLKENILAYTGIGNHKKKINTEEENKELTFKPKTTINKKNIPINNIDFETRVRKYEENKKEKIDKKQKELEEKEINKCTFQPNLFVKKRHEDKQQSNERFFDRLYNQHTKKIETIEKEMLKNREQTEIKELEECTFRPQTNTFINQNIFENKMEDRERDAYRKAIMRMQNGILESLRKKYLAEK